MATTMSTMKLLGEYNGKRIRVSPADADYINATDMCKAAGKEWATYWQNQGSQQFADVLSSNLGIPRKDLIYSRRGNQHQGGGTWVHRRIAIHLAQWCSAEFAVWVSEKIEQLMLTGSVVLHPEHQEADLDKQGQGLLYRTLVRVEQNGDQIQRILVNQDRYYEMYFELLKAMEHKTPEQREKIVRRMLQNDEGGIAEATLPTGDKVDLVIPGKWIIEVKHYKNYKAAIGQVKTYGWYCAERDAELRVHLFWNHDSPKPSDAKRDQIERECRRQGVVVTWHDWDELRPPKEQQRLLALDF